jgi:hypothetical protein
LDQCADLDLDKESFQIGVSLQYSWEPERWSERVGVGPDALWGSDRVGLDALYVFVMCLNSRQSSRYEIPDLKGMLCRLRYSVSAEYAACKITSLRSSFDQKFLNPTVPDITLPYKSSIRDISTEFKLRLDEVENRLSGPVLMDKLGGSLPSNRWVTRGWTFQEQNNSLRMFLLWPGGIQYNCPCSSTQYNGYYSDEDPVKPDYWFSRDPDGGEDPILDEDTFKKSHTAVKNIYGSSRWRREYLYFTWLQFATDYSHRVFTKQVDMFPALWAPAREYKRRLGDEYLMGIWKGDLWGFLWRLGSSGVDPPHDYLSPLRADFNSPDSGTIRALCSWSWMGNHRIKFLNQTGEMCDDLVDFRPECTISLGEFNARENDHSKGYDSTILKFRAKRTKPVSGFYNPELGRFENEVTVPVRFPSSKVFCALD